MPKIKSTETATTTATHVNLLKKIKDTNFLKQKTKDEYIQRITAFCEYLDKDLMYVMKHPKWFVTKVREYIEEEGYGIHTADKICSCFMACFNYNQDFKEAEKALFDEWVSETKAIKAEIDEKYESNAPTNKQKGAYISYETLIETRNKAPKGSQVRLLLFMYTEIPPVRNDYHLLRIYKSKPHYDTGNYIIIDSNNPMIILNDFKTDKTYEQIKIKIPESLLEEITESLKILPREYLFVSTRNKKPYNNDNTFSRWANRSLRGLFNNNMNLTTLRHIYISRRDLKLESKSGLERKEIAKIMGHSLEQQQRYLWHSWLEDNKIEK